VQIRWLEAAVSDLVEIRKYIAADKPQTAAGIALLIKQSVEPLGEYPDIGRPGRIDGTRELVLAALPYIIPYRVKNNAVEILRVLHAARKWPHDFE
jgi:toxin ParE1/3/4